MIAVIAHLLDPSPRHRAPEDVTWFVLKHPVTVSAAEIEQFSKLYRNNTRPTQPAHDRVVLESK